MRNLKTLTLGLALAIAPGTVFAAQTMNKAESNVQFTQRPQVDVSGTSAKISWKTDSASSAKVQYRPTTGGAWKTVSADASNGNKDFTANISGLTSGTTYEYQLVTNTGYVRDRGQFTAGGSSSAASTSNSSSTDNSSYENAKNSVNITQGPTVTADATGANATITWTTDKTAANQVQYRPVTGGAWKNAYERSGSTNHSLQLTGLQPGQTYQYNILNRDQSVRTSGQFTANANATSSASTTGTSSTATSTATSTGDKAPLYRAVNNSTGAHVYTQEQGSLPSGFQQEGVAGYVMKTQVSGTQPLYALSNSNGDFLYTTSASERSNAMSSLGYQDRGIAGYVATSQQSGTVPLYRMLNSSNKQHFYTADPNEHSQVLGKGFTDEGVAGYVWQNQ